MERPIALLMEANCFPEADILQSTLQEFSAVTKWESEGKEEAAAQLRAALHVVEDAVRDFEGHFIYPVAQRWGYLRLLTLVSAANTALREMVRV
jgi:hypothetical protein